MKIIVPIVAGLATVLAGCGNMVHVTPGTSVEVALARKPEVMRLAAIAEGPLMADNPAPRSRRIYVPPVEPALPTNDSLVAGPEAFSRGQDAWEQGKNDEAIAAFEQAVESDPGYEEAWKKLSAAYAKAGKTKKAQEALSRAHTEPQVQLR